MRFLTPYRGLRLGMHIRFVNGIYATDDPKEIEIIKRKAKKWSITVDMASLEIPTPTGVTDKPTTDESTTDESSEDKSAERLALEARAAELGVRVTKNMLDDTIASRIAEAEVKQEAQAAEKAAEEGEGDATDAVVSGV